jgi:hypothetical protein
MKLRPPEVKESGHPPYSKEDLCQIHVASGINILAGIWLATAPFILCPGQPVIRWNDTIAGLFLIMLGSLRCVHPLHRFWMSWLNAFVGLWLTASPFILQCNHIASKVNDTTLGFVVFVAGAVSASVRSGDR